jgi:hypothetical protein
MRRTSNRRATVRITLPLVVNDDLCPQIARIKSEVTGFDPGPKLLFGATVPEEHLDDLRRNPWVLRVEVMSSDSRDIAFWGGMAVLCLAMCVGVLVSLYYGGPTMTAEDFRIGVAGLAISATISLVSLLLCRKSLVKTRRTDEAA